MSTLQRLLRYPHAAVFDKAPAAEAVLRLRHPNSQADWLVSEGVLTATANATDTTYQLRELTVSELVDALRADGYQVTLLNAGFADHSALVLVEGYGSTGLSNGDVLSAFTSLLWALLSCYAGEVSEARLQVAEALRQMLIPTSSGEWLDLYSALYGVPRQPGETDGALAVRIQREAFRMRSNAHAIELAIRDETGWDVRIEEPWKDLFVMNESALSGGHKMYDGEFYGYHLLRPVSDDSVDWPTVRRIIERNRAAGVLALEVVPASHRNVIVAEYAGQYWLDLTWQDAQITWEADALISTSHTRQS